MPYQKIKTSSFQNLGGISNKISPYLVQQTEFTNLVNVDFQQPGSLTKRWGSTMYVGTTLSTKITGVYEYNITPIAGFGASIIVVTGESRVLQVFGTGYQQIYGSFGFTSVLLGVGAVNVGPTFISATFNVTGYTYWLGGTFWYDFETYSNVLWGGNGNNFWKFDGIGHFFSLPAPLSNFLVPVVGSSGVGSTATSFPGMTGVYYYASGYINNRGFYGAASVGTLTNKKILSANAAAETQGSTNVILHWDAPMGTTYGVDVGYGITAMAIYRAGPFATYLPANERTYNLIGTLALTGQTFIDSNLADSATLVPTCLGMVPEIWNAHPEDRIDVFGNPPVDFHPRYLELYNNQMFFSGFFPMVSGSTSVLVYEPSSVVFSDIGEPESIQPENNFDVRTNDGDQIRGMKSYLSSLLIFKTNTFHRLSGQDPANFALSEMSAQYGCVSNRAVCVAKNTCYFLDRKGIIAFNGANVDIISNKIDPIFARMNYPAALDQAIMTYDKVRNEILVEIPIDGSSVNNFTVVYDIIAQAFTTYNGISASSATIARGTLDNFSYLYGTYNGALLNVGHSYLSDNGTAYTALIQTRFFNEIDPATTKQWRRIFFNVDPVAGSTCQIDLIANYGTSVTATRYLQQTPYLSRIDFGIPSTALSFTLTNFSAVDTLRLHGFTMEYRFQRAVQDIES